MRVLKKYGKSDVNVEKVIVMKTSGATRGRRRGMKMDLTDVKCFM